MNRAICVCVHIQPDSRRSHLDRIFHYGVSSLTNELDYVLDEDMHLMSLNFQSRLLHVVHQFLAIPDNLIKCLINFYLIFSHLAKTRMLSSHALRSAAQLFQHLLANTRTMNRYKWDVPSYIFIGALLSLSLSLLQTIFCNLSKIFYTYPSKLCEQCKNMQFVYFFPIYSTLLNYTLNTLMLQFQLNLLNRDWMWCELRDTKMRE